MSATTATRPVAPGPGTKANSQWPSGHPRRRLILLPRDHTDIRRTGRPTMQAPIVSRDPRNPRRGPLSGVGLDEGPA
jgi:hypothetical protein